MQSKSSRVWTPWAQAVEDYRAGKSWHEAVAPLPITDSLPAKLEPNANVPYDRATDINPTGMFTEVRWITPDLAEQWLGHNLKNRKFRAQHAEKYAREIRDGGFMLTHQGVAFDTNGILLDGQHRLWGVWKTGIPVAMNVTFRADPRSYAVLDVGVKRQASDVLAIPAQHTAVLRWWTAIVKAPDYAVNHITTAQMQEEMEWAMPHIDALLGAGGLQGVKRISTAPVMFGVSVRMAVAAQPALVRSHYVDAIKMDFSKGLPEIVAIWVKQQMGNRIKTRGKFADAVRAWRAFDPENTATAQLNVRDDSVGMKEIHRALVKLKRGG